MLNRIAPILNRFTPISNRIALISNRFTPILNRIAPILNRFTPILNRIAPISNRFTPILNRIAPILGRFALILVKIGAIQVKIAPLPPKIRLEGVNNPKCSGAEPPGPRLKPRRSPGAGCQDLLSRGSGMVFELNYTPPKPRQDPCVS